MRPCATSKQKSLVNYLCAERWSSSWWLVCRRTRTECMGQCKFSSDQSGSGEARSSVGGCLLPASREQRPTYQPCQAGRRIKRHQLSSPVAEQSATHKDRFCVCVPLGMTGRAQVHTKAASEMLIWQQLNTLKDLFEEYHLTVDMTLVPSTLNLADHLTHVPRRWFDAMKKGNRPEPLISATQVDELNADQILTIHRNSRHSGVRRTTYFFRKVCPPTTKAAVRSAIQNCEKCQWIDPAPIHWQKGKLEVSEN